MALVWVGKVFEADGAYAWGVKVAHPMCDVGIGGLGL